MRSMFELLCAFLEVAGCEAQILSGEDTDLFSMQESDLLLLIENPCHTRRIFLYCCLDEENGPRMELHYGGWLEEVEGAGEESFAYLCHLIAGILSDRYVCIQIMAGSARFALLKDTLEEKIVSAVLENGQGSEGRQSVEEFFSLLAGQDVHVQKLSWKCPEERAESEF